MRAIGLMGLAIPVAMVTLSAAKAAASSGNAEETADRPPLFRFGPHQVGLSLGYGHGVKFAHSGVIEGHRVRELIVASHWQVDVTRRLAEHSWYGGVLALRAEGTLFVNFEPRSGVAGGLGLLLRYDFRGAGKAYPYVQAGAGVIGLDFDLADQDDGFAFIPQGGVGLVYRLSDRISFDLGVRFHHISNAYTHAPNGGIDTLQFLAGAAYHFE
jgi:opacity protein-like surface antigen